MSSKIPVLRLQLKKLEDENTEVRRERDEFRAELSKFRKMNGTLESRLQDLGVENSDLRRKLLKAEALPPPPQANEVIGRLSTKDTKPIIDDDNEVIEIPGSSDIEEPSSPLVRKKRPSHILSPSAETPRGRQRTSSRPFVLLTSRKMATRPTPSTRRSSTRIASLRISPEPTDSSPVALSPSPSLTVGNKRRNERNQSTREKKRQKETHDESYSVTGEPSPTAERMAGPSISPVGKRRAERARNHRAPDSTPSSEGESNVVHIPKREPESVKDDALRLTHESVAKYLQGFPHLNIKPTPVSHYFSRKLIWKAYGGSMITLLSRSTDQSRDFIFPTPDSNPHMPTTPGYPGLLLSCRRDMTEYICTMFSRAFLKPAQWEYMGEYRSQLAGQLTPYTFRQQTQATKDAWAHKLRTARKWPVYTAIRARIYLRKKKKALTDENIQAEIERITEKGTEGGSLTDRDVIDALERGDEQIDIIRMTCVSYDYPFFKDMIARSRRGRGKPKRIVDYIH
ncbi:hypothetical protein BDZ94DRAFT_1323091 [Collybia nuda]|uniref:DUF6697 domain-containing protein n=1 Tax=Collybia nuda TaxID=64659 RepID=A0A9P6CDK0_9AGAR|nr:hypothetical protein BDZ94DRAFT_1323091 [Collybia nuda]